MLQIIPDANSFDSAAIAQDYPYGFKVRCKKAYWVEYREGMGYRAVTRTTNPRKENLIWNAPKMGTYHAVRIWVARDPDKSTDDENWLCFLHFPHGGMDKDFAAVKEFLMKYGSQMSEEDMKRIKGYIIYSIKCSPNYYSNWLIPGEDGKLKFDSDKLAELWKTTGE